MLGLFRELIGHKTHADALLLQSVRHRPEAAADAEILALLHHILVANRFWLATITGEPFDRDEEMRAPESLDALIDRYATTHRHEAAWIAGATEADLARTLEHAMIPGGRCTVAQGLMQVCMHSQGHRAQIAKIYRGLGGAPPMTDFILWIANRQIV